ncbi:hypothetical protein Glove_186g28 [Diversispora epigaea]|uniref:U1-type domain-containing protein n=1 Tax=Diversispora epigaea TaxID=1348612 RepID=A0A397IQG6_9GLOM|nr:hypothetical protein Glove_186g28 [Diversispora epigaea]
MICIYKNQDLLNFDKSCNYGTNAKKKFSISTRVNEYPGVFREDGGIMFCNYCDLSIEWKSKSTVDGHCLSKGHISKKEIYEKNIQEKKQATITPLIQLPNQKKRLLKTKSKPFLLQIFP